MYVKKKFICYRNTLNILKENMEYHSQMNKLKNNAEDLRDKLTKSEINAENLITKLKNPRNEIIAQLESEENLSKTEKNQQQELRPVDVNKQLTSVKETEMENDNSAKVIF